MALQFYSNENFPIAMVNLLRSEGHDVLTSYEAGQANQGIPDDVVLEYATATGRILITENRQDFIDLHRTTPNHAGMIIFKHDRDYAGKVKAIIDFLDEDSRTLENRLLRVMKQNIKLFTHFFNLNDGFISISGDMSMKLIFEFWKNLDLTMLLRSVHLVYCAFFEHYE